ncbi:ABC transporter ATP-binding protein [Capillibacterium thermochitinicola]|uniref:ABC transporter ATP-binding protein n=1 Tax=Capillibacterium thermochitinicola TaxID=2699427 RepID=A0A8J6LS79_9FIRM|nr:ABC transporter ATP-binding protein [Capillibacterium thermochitinicola]
MNQFEFTLSGITKSYGSLQVLAGLSLTVKTNSIVALLGPSGCGKTTLLSIIAGLKKPDQGQVTGVDNKPISYLFQEPRLLDWLTVAENLAFVLKDHIPRSELTGRINYYLEQMAIAAYRDAYPRKLSGGQQQRVAIARALAYPSRLLLMDEPFKSLDLSLKWALMTRFLQLWAADPRTVVFVTHDPKEALLLADEVYVLSPKPTVVKSHHVINLPRPERKPTALPLLQLEQRISADLIGEEETLTGYPRPSSP